MRNESYGRISFRGIKELVRNKNFDFSDDGSYFRGYVYKGMLPVTVCSYEDEVYISPRYDYVVRGTELSNFDFELAKSFNGIKKNIFSQEKFGKVLDYVLSKVLEVKSEKELKDYCDKQERTFFKSYCVRKNGRYVTKYYTYTRKY